MSASDKRRLPVVHSSHGHPFGIVWDGQSWGPGEFPGAQRCRRTPSSSFAWQPVRSRWPNRPATLPQGPARKSSIGLVTSHAATGVDMRPHVPIFPANFRTAILKIWKVVRQPSRTHPDPLRRLAGGLTMVHLRSRGLPAAGLRHRPGEDRRSRAGGLLKSGRSGGPPSTNAGAGVRGLYRPSPQIRFAHAAC